MDVIARGNTVSGHEKTGGPARPSPAALWSALAADLRAHDERTARLRAMRLIRGDDAAA